jgi:hypothetical protein
MGDEHRSLQAERANERGDPGGLLRAAVVPIRGPIGVAKRRQVDGQAAKALVAQLVHQGEDGVGRRHGAPDEQDRASASPAALLVPEFTQWTANEGARPWRNSELFGLAEVGAGPKPGEDQHRQQHEPESHLRRSPEPPPPPHARWRV